MVTAVSRYGISFDAAISRDNVFATQFHPEKSGQVGLAILNNFVKVVGGMIIYPAIDIRGAVRTLNPGQV